MYADTGEKMMVSLPDEKTEEFEPGAGKRQTKSLPDPVIPIHRPKVQRSYSHPDVTRRRRLIKSRLDHDFARTLRDKYNFPKPVLTRALRLQFDYYEDDFLTLHDFYKACVDVLISFGIRPPTINNPLRIEPRHDRHLSRIQEDGIIMDEETVDLVVNGDAEYPKNKNHDAALIGVIN